MFQEPFDLGAWDGAYLLSLVESLAVAVGQVHGTGHHPRAGFKLLQGSLHVPAAGALCAERRDERHGRTRWKPPPWAEHVAWERGLGVDGGDKGSVGKATSFCFHWLLPATFPPPTCYALGVQSVQNLHLTGHRGTLSHLFPALSGYVRRWSSVDALGGQNPWLFTLLALALCSLWPTGTFPVSCLYACSLRQTLGPDQCKL